MKAFHYRLPIAECDVCYMDFFLFLSGRVFLARSLQARKPLASWRPLKVPYVFMTAHFRCIKILTYLLSFGTKKTKEITLRFREK